MRTPTCWPPAPGAIENLRMLNIQQENVGSACACRHPPASQAAAGILSARDGACIARWYQVAKAVYSRHWPQTVGHPRKMARLRQVLVYKIRLAQSLSTYCDDVFLKITYRSLTEPWPSEIMRLAQAVEESNTSKPRTEKNKGPTEVWQTSVHLVWQRRRSGDGVQRGLRVVSKASPAPRRCSTRYAY